MIIKNLHRFIEKPIKGVFHVGAHHAEEKSWYDQNNIKNIVWFEANFNYETIIKKVVGNDLVICCAVGNENKKIKFNVANNGQSSSILDFGSHSKHHPEVFYVGQIEVEMKRMVDIVNEHKIQIENYNFINMDIQGYELEALKGFENILDKFDYIYTEVNTGNVYDGCPQLSDLDKFLMNFGFQRVTEHITPFEWGDAFYVKK